MYIFSKNQIYPANEVLEKMRFMIKKSFHNDRQSKKFKFDDGIVYGIGNY